MSQKLTRILFLLMENLILNLTVTALTVSKLWPFQFVKLNILKQQYILVIEQHTETY